MNNLPLVVFPDADADDPATLARIDGQLEGICRFRGFEGQPASDEEWIARIADAAGILIGWGIPDTVLAGCPALKVVSFTGTGAGKFVNLALAREQGITVCNCPGYADITVAEHALALMLSAARHVARLDRDLRQGQWNTGIEGVELSGKTVGLVGFGGIGRRFAVMCQALGMDVMVWTPSMDRSLEDRFGIRLATLDAVLAGSDVVSLHLASVPATRNIIDARAFSLMREGVILINSARAELVEQGALVDALTVGRVAAAGLDVFHDEPIAPDDLLLSLDNVTLSPHVAYNTPEANRRLMDIAVENLVGYFRGNPQNVVLPDQVRQRGS